MLRDFRLSFAISCDNLSISELSSIAWTFTSELREHTSLIPSPDPQPTSSRFALAGKWSTFMNLSIENNPWTVNEAVLVAKNFAQESQVLSFYQQYFCSWHFLIEFISWHYLFTFWNFSNNSFSSLFSVCIQSSANYMREELVFFQWHNTFVEASFLKQFWNFPLIILFSNSASFGLFVE